MALHSDAKVVVFAAGLFLLLALLLGVLKYRQMTASPKGEAHPYTDVAHRAALLYSFATLLIATLVQFSAWSNAVNLIAAFAMIAFFAMSVANYTRQGITRGTDNEFRDPMRAAVHPYMYALIATEIAGLLVLLVGYAKQQF